jgi:hypothetical protein
LGNGALFLHSTQPSAWLPEKQRKDGKEGKSSVYSIYFNNLISFPKGKSFSLARCAAEITEGRTGLRSKETETKSQGPESYILFSACSAPSAREKHGIIFSG